MLSKEIGGGAIRGDVQIAIAAELERRLDRRDDGEALSPKHRELILLSLSATRLNACLSELHARRAVRLGASPAEVRDAALSVILVGMIRWKMAGMGAFVASLHEAKAELTRPVDDLSALREHVHRVLDREFPDMFETLASAAPGVLDGYLKLRGNILRQNSDEGALPKWLLELMVTTCDVVQGNSWGAQMHVRQAVRDGATPVQALECIVLAMIEGGVPVYKTGGLEVIEAAEDEARRATEQTSVDT
jgi:alkylhydroperoxidase/carboxymuconolactone decarboxylase family protein YurZ